jgi:hypothetical protein
MANIFTNYISGNDTTGSGDILAPYKTVAKALTVQVQGDTIKVMADEVITAAWAVPVRNTRLTVNSIIGVNASGIEDGTRRVITQTGGVSWMTSGASYQWSFRNFEVQGFTAAVPLATSATNAYSGAEWYNCKFKSCGTITGGNNFNTQNTFRKCVFEDIAVTGIMMGNTTVSSQFIGCTFRRCSTTAIASNLLFAIVIKSCLFADCSTARYGLQASSVLEDVIIDRFICTGTGNVDNAIISISQTIQNMAIRNILVTNSQLLGTQTTALRGIIFLSTTIGQVYYVENIAIWNVANTPNRIKKSSNPQLVAIIAENAPIELTESPWKNDDGIIANSMSSYEYKENYAWRRKQQALTDISGWSYLV